MSEYSEDIRKETEDLQNFVRTESDYADSLLDEIPEDEPTYSELEAEISDLHVQNILIKKNFDELEKRNTDLEDKFNTLVKSHNAIVQENNRLRKELESYEKK